jgi:hypothetical protein
MKKGGAPEGNKNGTKIKDAEMRQRAYKSFCDHIAEGYPQYAWFFDEDGYQLCWKTMRRYIDENPVEFPPLLMNRANSKKAKYWIDEGKKLMSGKYKGGSPVAWQTIARNTLKDEGWESAEVNKIMDPEQTKNFGQLIGLLHGLQKKE